MMSGAAILTDDGDLRALPLAINQCFLSLPPGGQSLARSRYCPHQAFAWGERILGLQFHAEMQLEEVGTLIRAHAPLPLGPSIQLAEAMLDEPARYAEQHQYLYRLLDRWLPA